MKIVVTKIGLVLFATSCLASCASQRESIRQEPRAAMRDEEVTEMLEQGDREVASSIHLANKYEVELGRLAERKSQTQEVKRYAEHLVNDHEAADLRLAGVLRDLDVRVPDRTLTSNQQDSLDRLQKASGSEFDREFLRIAESEHEKTIASLRESQGSVESDELKEYVSSLLPILERHREEATRLRQERFAEAR